MMPQLTAGSTLGRYELLLPVAKGGMAQVWAARLRGSRGFQKLVAVKTILAGAIDSTRLEQMFLEEAQLASQIHHTNVVETLELGEHEGTLYLVMEWVDGEPISQVLAQATEKGGLPLPVAVNLIAQVCHGLHAAHELRDENGNLVGVVHRDVSPQNVLVTPSGRAKLVDFGIAKATGRASSMTQQGEVKGKFGYMAPEQVQGHKVDRRSDIFALGILAYLLTTGKHPFRGENPAVTIRNIMSDKPPEAPSSLVADFPPALDAVIMRAIEKAPERRFATAEDLLVALEAALPEALETGMTTQISVYLQSLLGSRATARRAAIRHAQDMIDKQRGEGTSTSNSTLRAISLDSIPDSDSATPASQPSAAGLAAAEQSASNPFAAAPLSRRRAAWTAAAAVAGGLVVALYSFAKNAPITAGVATPSAAAAAAPVAGATLAVAPSAPVPAPIASAAEAPSTPLNDDDAALEKSKKLKATRGRTAPRAVAPAMAAPAMAVPPSAPAAAVAPKPIASTNAWDRDAFGGRH